MLPRGNGRLGNLGPGYQVVGIEVAHLEAGDEQAAQRTVDVGLLDFTALDGLR